MCRFIKGIIPHIWLTKSFRTRPCIYGLIILAPEALRGIINFIPNAPRILFQTSKIVNTKVLITNLEMGCNYLIKLNSRFINCNSNFKQVLKYEVINCGRISAKNLEKWDRLNLLAENSRFLNLE